MAHNRRLSQFANTVGYNGGSIGLGTESPHAKLEVSGGQNQTANQFTDLVSIAANANNDGIAAEVQLNFGISPSHTAEANRKARIQSVTHGGTVTPLLINPAGGTIGIGTDDPSSLIHGQVSSGSAILTLKSTATSGEASVSLSGKNSSGTVRTGIFKYDNSDMFRIGTTAGIPIRFETNDAERLRIDSGGTIKCGTSSVLKAEINNSVSGHQFISQCDDNNNGFEVYQQHGSNTGRNNFAVYGNTGDSNAKNLQFAVRGDGKIQVTGTRGGTLQPSDNDSLELFTKATSGNASTGGGITFYNHHGGGHIMGGVIHVVKANGVYENSSSDMLFGTRIQGSSVAYRARLTSVGDWQTYSSNVNIDIANTQSSGNNEAYIYARYGSTGLGAGTLSFRVYTNGNVQNTNNSYGSISDQNLKENIVDATSQWDDIKALQVRKYNFRENTGHQTHTQLGLIAQEVETVSPGLVETTAVREGETCLDADGNQLESIKSINYSVLYMKSVKALQEAQTRIETLEAQVAALQGS